MEKQLITNILFIEAAERFEYSRSQNDLIAALHTALLRLPEAPRAEQDDYAEYQRHSGHFERLPYEQYIAGSKEEILATMLGNIFAFCRANKIDITEYLTLLIDK